MCSAAPCRTRWLRLPLPGGRRPWAIFLLVSGILLGGLLFGKLVAGGPSQALLSLKSSSASRTQLYASDAVFHAATVGRNCHALLEQPMRFWEAEQCAPADHTLTLSHSFATMTLLALPAYALTADPILAHNLALILLTLLPLFAFSDLAYRLTGSRAAAAALAVPLTFHPARIGPLPHAIAFDVSWGLLAGSFGMRTLHRPHWLSTAAAGCCLVLQAGASPYAFLATAFVILPLGLAMLLHRKTDWRKLSLHLLGIAALAAGGTAALYLPYRAAPPRSTEATTHFFLDPGELLSESEASASPIVLGLALWGLLSGLRRGGPPSGRSARVALVAGGTVALWFSLGPHAAAVQIWGHGLPDLHSMATWALPPLSGARAVRYVGFGTALALHLLACFPLASTFARVGPRRAAGLKMTVAVGACILALGSTMDARRNQEVIRARPPKELLAFFRRLEQMGDRGPVVELPLDTGLGRIRLAPPRVLAAAYHHRRTSACYASVLPSERRDLEDLVERLPSAQAVARLWTLGFRTLVVHLDRTPPAGRPPPAVATSLRKASSLPRLLRTRRAAAFRIPPARPAQPDL